MFFFILDKKLKTTFMNLRAPCIIFFVGNLQLFALYFLTHNASFTLTVLKTFI